jgi:hypothetical protein
MAPCGLEVESAFAIAFKGIVICALRQDGIGYL